MSSNKAVSKSRCKCSITIPKGILEKTKLKTGDWVELTINKKMLRLKKVNMVEIKVELPEEIVKALKRYQEEEGYESFIEAASNALYQGLRLYLIENEEKDLGEKWFLEIH